MRTYNPDAVQYRFLIMLPGATKDITKLIGRASDTHTKDGISKNVDMTIKNIKEGSKWIHSDLYLGKTMKIEAKDETKNWTEVFRGIVTKWGTMASDFTIDITVEDANNVIPKSDGAYFFDGKTNGASRIKRMIQDIGLPVGKIDGPSVKLSKKMVNGSVSAEILEILEESAEKENKHYYVRSNKGAFEVVARGSNSEIYVLDSHTSSSGSDEHSISRDYANVVKIYGNKEEGKMPVLSSTVSGDTKYGRIQKVIYKSDYDTAGEANSAAKTILNKNSKPEIKQTVDHVDIPWIQLGDAVDVMVGTIGSMKDGKQVPVRRYVEAITRNYKDGTMILEVVS